MIVRGRDFSFCQKMMVRGRDFEEVYDLLAVRHEVAKAVMGQDAAVFIAPALVGTAFFADTPRLVAEVAFLTAMTFLTAMIGPFKVVLRRTHDR
jgi:hypothetical protein